MVVWVCFVQKHVCEQSVYFSLGKLKLPQTRKSYTGMNPFHHTDAINLLNNNYALIFSPSV